MSPMQIRYLLSTGLAVSAMSMSAELRADVDCQSFSNAVVIAGSTAVKPLLAEMAKVLVVPQSSMDTTSQGPVTILYAGAGSCVGVDAILNGTKLTATSLSYWDSQGSEQTCSLGASAGGAVADIGISDVFPETCAPLPNGLPSNVQDFQGPVQSMTFVVPHSSTQDAISAEAAYYVFGFGADSGVDPWTDESFLFRRNAQSGTQRMIAAAIGVDAAIWKGAGTASSSDLRQQVIAAGNGHAEAALGILAADEADENRATLDVLAYQHYGQTCAYYPDRDASSNEKQNVRDGHYLIWGPTHLLTTVDGNRHPSNPVASSIIGYLVGTKVPPVGLDLIYLDAQRHVIPQCAMRVSRSQEIGPLTPYAPADPCGCYYEKVANGTTDCKACDSDKDCSGASALCRYHYCESP